MRAALRLLVGLLVPLAAARGQEATPALGELRLRVVDTAGRAVEAAEVALRGDRASKPVREHRMRADADGVARFPGVEPGLWVAEVRRLGTRPVRTTVRVGAGANLLTVRVEPAAAALAGVRVVGGTPVSARLDDFERRRLAGMPSATVTRDAIERLAPIALSRLLRGLGGIRIGDSLGNVVAISTRGDKPTRLMNGATGFAMVQCVLRVAVDGVLLPALSHLDAITPSDVHGIEVYFGPARLPPELAGLRSDNWCGVVAIWTRDR